ncbi:2-amino-3-carboxymuconate-6-semialdehyde decarboxylase [Purpureocillium lavendulum]|uniref:2-amino-3-carboxymuconate-6-semialdehyde decarboxylase n=1 Tax=Purpureocillium lavendulum TaxID=1247861 RepID=A0AB34FUE4_9HYPO|nr:2-amino-3-carboxymuconate-6-semialdehyde decarboxylase [Purpureocillium lavendulum]
MAASQTVGPISTPGPGTSYLRSELQDLKIIGVEEHVVFPELTKVIPSSAAADHAKATQGHPGKDRVPPGALRLKDMDEGGISVQVLSFGSAVNCTHMDAAAGYELARSINNSLKAAVDANPTRFRAFAELPLQDPALAIKELRRCVHELGFVGAMMAGSVGGTGKFLDGPEFAGLLSEFEALDVPLYLHPGIAPEPVSKTYYEIDGNPLASASLSAMGWGWHSEVAIHVLRLAVSGVLDAHPKLKLVIGHQGEMLPMMMQRLDGAFDMAAFGLARPVGETLRRQVWIAISGLFSLPVTQIAIQTWGVDRVLFANDYPYIETQGVPGYVRAMNDILAPSDMRKVFQENSEALFKFSA